MLSSIRISTQRVRDYAGYYTVDSYSVYTCMKKFFDSGFIRQITLLGTVAKPEEHEGLLVCGLEPDHPQSNKFQFFASPAPIEIRSTLYPLVSLRYRHPAPLHR
ncbi:hypothetical protein VIBNIAM115_120020 [Vibrio nigripulchritudo AM115]|nr:hypothetical protein VIBNIAM115_120020 [Vibrio nigripulchritudo AM115]